LIDSNAKANLIYPRLFKDIIVKKLKPTSIIKALFEELQESLRYYNILFDQSPQTDNYRIQITYYRYNNTKHIVSRYLYTRYRKYNQLDHHISNYLKAATGSNYKPTIK